MQFIVKTFIFANVSLRGHKRNTENTLWLRLITRRSIGGRIKRCIPAVCLSVRSLQPDKAKISMSLFVCAVDHALVYVFPFVATRPYLGFFGYKPVAKERPIFRNHLCRGLEVETIRKSQQCRHCDRHRWMLADNVTSSWVQWPYFGHRLTSSFAENI